MGLLDVYASHSLYCCSTFNVYYLDFVVAEYYPLIHIMFMSCE